MSLRNLALLVSAAAIVACHSSVQRQDVGAVAAEYTEVRSDINENQQDDRDAYTSPADSLAAFGNYTPEEISEKCAGMDLSGFGQAMVDGYRQMRSEGFAEEDARVATEMVIHILEAVCPDRSDDIEIEAAEFYGILPRDSI